MSFSIEFLTASDAEDWAHDELIENSNHPSDRSDMIATARELIAGIDVRGNDFWRDYGFALDSKDAERYAAETAFIQAAMAYWLDYARY